MQNHAAGQLAPLVELILAAGRAKVSILFIKPLQLANIVLRLGQELHKKYPDFVAVKVIPTKEDSLRKQYVVCVVEIKAGENEEEPGDEAQLEESEEKKLQRKRKAQEAEIRQSTAQMAGYMETLINHPYRDPNLEGFLIRRHQFCRFRLFSKEGMKGVDMADQWEEIFAPGDPLTLALCGIALRHWNMSKIPSQGL